MLKTTLRKKFKVQREQLTEEQIAELSLSIANSALSLPIWDLEYYHTFLPIAHQKEVDTQYLLHILQGKDKNIVLPRMNDAQRTLSHFLLMDSTRIVENKWGVPEPDAGIEIHPEKLDVVFIPLLAFDKQGQRVGYGKGFYDGFLANCRDNVLKIGVSFFEPVARIEDVLPFDVGLDYCITASQIYKFKKS